MADYGSLETRVRAEAAAMRAEDDALESLSAGVARTKMTATAVSDEVISQHALLDDLETGLSRAQDASSSAHQRTDALERDPYSPKAFCMLLVPIVLLMLIILFWIKHFLFG